MTVWIVWRELIGGAYGFRGVYSNKRAVLEDLRLLAEKPYDVNERVKIVDGWMNVRLRAVGEDNVGAFVATVHDAEEAVAARQECDRIGEVPEVNEEVVEAVAEVPLRRLAWIRELIGSHVGWYSQAEPYYPDGRFSISRNADMTYTLFSVEPDAPSGSLFHHANLDLVMAAAEERYTKTGILDFRDVRASGPSISSGQSDPTKVLKEIAKMADSVVPQNRRS